MFHVGGSLTDLYDTEKHTITKQYGGGIADDIMKGANMLNNISIPDAIPKVVIPDNSNKETIPSEEITNTVIDHARSLEQSSFSFSAIFNTILVYVAKILFVGFEIENKSAQNWAMFFVWMLIAALLFGIASGISNTNITFIMYCSAMWIIAMAIIFVIIQPYRGTTEE
jgi:hypothetical protein